MFSPSQTDVRRFFCSVYSKWQQGAPMEAIESLAQLWMAEHPEFFAELADVEAAVLAVEPSGNTTGNTTGSTTGNAFLHLSMHLTISEQCSIDQPAGIRQAVELLVARRDSLHDAHHEVMECLGEMLWESQRSGRPPDGHAYLERVRARATRD